MANWGLSRLSDEASDGKVAGYAKKKSGRFLIWGFILYGGKRVGTYRPDFVVDDKILVEIKAVPVMPNSYDAQLRYYLKGTSYKLGFLINFGSRHIEIRRKVWTVNYQRKSGINQR